jgi:hypothetical protein
VSAFQKIVVGTFMRTGIHVVEKGEEASERACREVSGSATIVVLTS